MIISRYPSLRSSLSVLAALMLTQVIPAQSVSIQNRELIDATAGVRETALSATSAVRIAVYIKAGVASGIGYAYSNATTSGWIASTIPTATVGGGTVAGFDDPSIAVLDPQLDDFIVCARKPPQVAVNLYSATTDTFSGWQTVMDSSVGGFPVDKSWVISRGAGEVLVTAFSISSPIGIHYSRSSDGGLTWHADQVLVQGNPVNTAFCPQPTTSGDGKVYVAWMTASPALGGSIRLLAGRSGSNNTMNFANVVDSSGVPISIPVHLDGENMPAPGTPTSKTVPYLLADPTSVNRLYVAYHDIAPDDSSDINIYLVRIDYSEQAHAWTSQPAVRVNTDPVVASPRPDQFTPAMAIDGRGRIHVTFYDNRAWYPNYPASAAYDMYYALSVDHGLTFTNWNMWSTPAVSGSSVFAPGEYNGIAIVDSPTAAQVWTSYTGNDQLGSTGIFGTKILVSYP